MARLRRVAVLAALLVPLGGIAPATASAAEPGQSAELEKSVVALHIKTVANVRYPTDGGGEDLVKEPMTVEGACSGFLVSATGDIVTAGHCVDPQEIRRDILIEALIYMEKTKAINSAKQWLEYALKNWDVEGTSKGSKPETRVRVTQPESVGGPVKFNHNAQILDYKSFNDGDVALLRVSGISGALPLPIAAQDPAVGTKLVSVGFPAAVGRVIDENQRASFKTGTASSQQTSPKGVPQTEVNSDLSGGMSGGPTVDESGNVLGVNSFLLRNQQNFNFITDTTDLGAFVRQHGVSPVAPRSAPKAPGESTGDGAVPMPASDSGGGFPWWILAAVVAVLLVAAGGGFVWYRRNQRRPIPVEQPVTPAFVGTAMPQYGPQVRPPNDPPGCDHRNNPPGVRFCNTCGAPLS
jgi:S1-C subfamily serine protease